MSEKDERLNRKQMRDLVDSYYDIQDMRKAVVSRLTSGEVKEERVLTIITLIKEAEKEAKKAITRWVKTEEIRVRWLTSVRGIGPVLSAGLVAYFGYCENFDTVSKLWAYSGFHVIQRCRECDRRVFKNDFKKEAYINRILERLRELNERKKKKKEPFNEAKQRKKIESWICKCTIPIPYGTAPRRRKGELIDWNPKARVLGWKIAQSLVRKGGKYREKYDEFKATEQARNPELSKGHIDNRAKRKLVKLFLSHYWEMTRTIIGLPVRQPYAMDKLGHTTFTSPLRDKP